MAKKNKQKQSDNYLDFIPMHHEQKEYNVDAQGKVTVLIENKGIFNRIAQKVFHRPKITQVHLDDMGNFIWKLMDGRRSVYDIALLVKEEFGEQAEPLYDRLVTYMKTLESYGFIRMDKAEK